MSEVGYTETEYDPDYVVIGESSNFIHAEISKAASLVHHGARLIATNPDVADPVENGNIEPAGGAWASVIEVATGRKAYYPGKPNPLMIRKAIQKLGLHSDDIAIIGDRMDTDILSGIEANVTHVLVLSGISNEHSVDIFPYRPNLILRDIGCVPPSDFVLNKC